MDPDDSAPFLSDPPPALGLPAGRSPPHAAAPGSPGGPGPEPGPRYAALGLLGAGGMGRVEAVHDGALGRQVARKRPRPDVPGAATALVHEAAVTAALEHPGIVPVYDLGRDADGTPWYTMRLVRGRTLRAVLGEAGDDAGRLALVRSVLAAVQAVAHAHDRGVVHCDLKAGNILLGERGEVQVVDWGLARSGGGGASGGTPAAMSPEQARGEAPTPACDVWALGCVLIEVLTGAPPWQGRAREAVRLRLKAGATPPERPDPATVPAELCAIVERCLQADPADRYPDAGALAADLAAFLDGRLVQAHAYTRPELLGRWLGRHRVAVGVAGFALVVVAVVSALAVVRTVRERDAARAAQAVAVAAQGRSDASLADALVLAARTAAGRAAWPEAEVLAARALTLSESPEARGIAAIAAARPRPPRTPSPTAACAGRRHPGPGGRVLCVETDGLALLVDGERRWSVPYLAEDVAFAGQDVVISVRGPEIRVLDGGTGAVRSAREAFNVRPLRDGAAEAWLHTGSVLGRIDAQTGAITRSEPCGALAVGAVGAGVDGWLHIACAGGGLVDLEVASGRVHPRPYSGDDLAAPVSLLVAGPGGAVAVASNRGAVTVGGEEGERWAVELDAVVVALAWTGDGRRLVAGVRGGGAVVLDAASGARLARLPAAAGSQVEGREGGAVWTPGRGGERWDLSGLRPHVLGGGPGLSSAAFGHDDDVVLGRGDGVLARVDAATGATLATAALTTRVLKGVVRSPGPPGFVVVGAGDGAWWLPPDLGAHRSLLRGGGRRVGVVGDHVVVLHYGERGSRIGVGGARGPSTFQGSGAHMFDLGTDEATGQAFLIDDDGVVWRLDAAWGAAPERVAEAPGATCLDALPGGGVVWAAPGALVLAPSGGDVTRFPLSDVPTLDLAVSLEGDLLAAAGLDGRVRVVALPSGRLRAVLEGHEERVAGVDWAPGSRLMTASWDGTARLWSLATLDRPGAALLAEAESAWGISAAAAVAAGAP